MKKIIKRFCICLCLMLLAVINICSSSNKKAQEGLPVRSYNIEKINEQQICATTFMMF